MQYIKEFFDFTSRTITDWPLGTILMVLILAVLLFIIWLLCWGMFIVLDSWFRPKIRGEGKVIGKTFTPAHTQFIPIYNSASKITTLHPVYHPDNWSLVVDVDGMQDSISVYESFYRSLSISDVVNVEYVYGRISKKLYIKNIYS